MNPLAQFVANLLADNPSLKAAMKAGQETTISARVWRAKEQRWVDLGVVSKKETSIQALLRYCGITPKITVRFRVNGKDYERS